MALISCPECGESVSTDAFSCPHCGKRLVEAWKAGRFSKGAAITAIIVLLVVVGICSQKCTSSYIENIPANHSTSR